MFGSNEVWPGLDLNLNLFEPDWLFWIHSNCVDRHCVEWPTYQRLPSPIFSPGRTPPLPRQTLCPAARARACPLLKLHASRAIQALPRCLGLIAWSKVWHGNTHFNWVGLSHDPSRECVTLQRGRARGLTVRLSPPNWNHSSPPLLLWRRAPLRPRPPPTDYPWSRRRPYRLVVPPRRCPPLVLRRSPELLLWPESLLPSAPLPRRWAGPHGEGYERGAARGSV
jgi:hypothetical protein